MTPLEELRSERKQLEAEREQIIFDSTAERLNRNRIALMELVKREAKLNREVSRKASELVSPEVDELRERSIELQHKEIQLSGSIVLAEKFIRPDAVEFFRGDLDKRTAALDAKLARFGTGNTRPGPRLLREASELSAESDQWKATAKLCRLGERIHAIHEELAAIRERQQELEAERQKQAVAAI